MKAAKTVDDYLEAAPADKRAALTRIRATIRAAVPAAVEGIGYGIAGYKYKGKPLVYFGYAKGHCALYGPPVAPFKAELQAYDVSKGTIRFQADDPLPAKLVTKLVKARMRDIDRGG